MIGYTNRSFLFVNRCLIFAMLCAVSPAASAADAAENTRGAIVTGVVRDSTEAAIPGATVTAERLGTEAPATVEVTDGNGAFRIAGLAPGDYVLMASLDGFKATTRSVRLVTGQSLQLAFTIVPEFGETVEVIGESSAVGEVEILENRRQAPVVSDSISAAEIRKTPDSNAASVVERLTGVTLLGDKYVFVRGLGERYSGTTINGSAIATTETEKRVVPLDLFPAKLLDTVNVIKTYTPDRPGDFGSGIVEMTTTQFPSAQTLKFSMGAAYLSGTTGSDYSRYAGGLNRQGNGGQKLPSGVPTAYLERQSVLNPDGFTPLELEAIGEAFVGSWSGDAADSAAPATDFSLTYGNTFGKLGVVVSGTSNHGYDTINEVQRFYGVDGAGSLIAINDYDLTTYRESANSGIVGNVSLRLSDQHRVYLNSVFTRDASAESREQEGLQTNSGGDIRDIRVRYQMEEILSTRLRGEHNFSGPAIGSLVEWNLAHSDATNDSDLRENIYRESDPGVFEMQTGFADSGKLEYFNLDDQIDQGGLAWSLFFAGRGTGFVEAGADHFERTRDFAARRFRFATSDHQQFDLTLSPEEIYTPDNIRPGGFEIREFTGVNDAYDAEHTIESAYVMGDVALGKWRFIGGARYEDSTQRVTTFNPFEIENEVESLNEKTDVLPSLNVVYQLRQRTNLRFAYGRSLNRPEFRELSPFTFTEVAGGRSVSGNPDLEQATLDSYDLRWESFSRPGEVIALSAFYKNIDQPIERIVQPTSDLRLSFVNAERAKLYGLELELRTDLDRIGTALKHWSVNANFAYIESDVTVGAQQFSVVTNTERPLEGQSNDVVNLALQYFQPQWGTMFRVLAAHSGERLTEVGAFGLPDTYESAFTSVDVVFSQSLQRVLPGLEVKVAGVNLLDEKREFLQGGETQRLFDPGRKLSLSLSYTPF
ncbi:MAG: TonB-dependent receptor [Thermoanaerobaculia bacterium]